MLGGSGNHYVRWKRQFTAPCVVIMHVVSLCVQCSYETCLCYLSVVVLLAFAFLDATWEVLLREVSNELKKAVMILFLHSSGGIGIYICDRKLVLWWELFSPSMVLLRCNNGSKSTCRVSALACVFFWARIKNYVYASLYTSPCCHMYNSFDIKMHALPCCIDHKACMDSVAAVLHTSSLCFMCSQVLVGCPNVIFNRWVYNHLFCVKCKVAS